MKKILCVALLGLFAMHGTVWGYDEKSLKSQLENLNVNAIMQQSVKSNVTSILQEKPILFLGNALADWQKLVKLKQSCVKQKDVSKNLEKIANLHKIISYFLKILNDVDINDTKATAIKTIANSKKTELEELKSSSPNKDLNKEITIFLGKFKTDTKKSDDSQETLQLKTGLGQLSTSLGEVKEKLGNLNTKLLQVKTKL